MRKNSFVWHPEQPPQEIIEYKRNTPKVEKVTQVTFVNTWCEIK
jgi:hypothetical protein